MTLWGPTHVLMIGGASLATLGLWVLLAEATRLKAAGATGGNGARRGDGNGAGAATQPHERAMSGLVRFRRIATAGSFMMGLSTLQGEFDYGVPQFQLVFHPILLMLAAGPAARAETPPAQRPRPGRTDRPRSAPRDRPGSARA